jgi:ATP-binding cassette subfamily F protein 3
MLSVNNIAKSYGVKPVLKDVSFQLNEGEKLGLIGLNGTGKTTLLEIVTGSLKPDKGSVDFTPSDLRIGYLHQGLVLPEGETVYGFLNRTHGNPAELSTEIENLARDLTQNPADREKSARYDRLLSDLQLAYESAGMVEPVLAKLGLDGISPDTVIRQLSGGQKTRLGLARILVSNPQLLLLDEPTNHLDIEMLEWLEGWLKQTRCAVLIVSHDRAFLDGVVGGILELDEHTHTIREFAGNYTGYIQQKRDEREKQWNDYVDQQDEIHRLRKSAAGIRDQARYHRGGKTDPGSTDGFSIGFFANRTKETNQRAKNLEKRIEHLLTDEHVDRPSRTWQMKVDFQNVTESGRDVVVMENLFIGYGDRVLGGPINLTVRYGDRIVLTGPNGCGKSTLLRTITGAIPALDGRVRLGAGVKPGLMAQEQETLEGNKRVLDVMLDKGRLTLTETRSYLSKYLFTGDEVFTIVNDLSYGERVRLSLACLVIQGCNLLILDEPINHLDIPSRERFEQALAEFQGTVLAVVHDRAFIRHFARQVWKMEDGQIAPDYRWDLE